MCLSTEDPPFRDEEDVYAAVTTPPRSAAIPLAATDFTRGGLPRESYVNPWVLVTMKHADIQGIEGQLTDDTVDKIAQEGAINIGALDGYLDSVTNSAKLLCHSKQIRPRV